MIIVALRKWLVSMGSLVNDVLKIQKKLGRGVSLGFRN